MTESLVSLIRYANKDLGISRIETQLYLQISLQEDC